MEFRLSLHGVDVGRAHLNLRFSLRCDCMILTLRAAEFSGDRGSLASRVLATFLKRTPGAPVRPLRLFKGPISGFLAPQRPSRRSSSPVTNVDGARKSAFVAQGYV